MHSFSSVALLQRNGSSHAKKIEAQLSFGGQSIHD